MSYACYTEEDAGLLLFLTCSPRVRWVRAPIGSNQMTIKSVAVASSARSIKEKEERYWLARNQNNVSEWGDMSIRGMLFQ